jgi:hypothetical protein
MALELQPLAQIVVYMVAEGSGKQEEIKNTGLQERWTNEPDRT